MTVQIINRPGVAGAVLQTPLRLIEWVTDHFPPNDQFTVNRKPLELGGGNFYTMFSTSHVSHFISNVTCHVSCVRWKVFFLSVLFCFLLHICGASWWRVCYQWGRPHLVLGKGGLFESLIHNGVCRTSPGSWVWALSAKTKCFKKTAWVMNRVSSLVNVWPCTSSNYSEIHQTL